MTLVSSPPVIPNPVARFRRTGVRDLLFPGCPVLASFARVGILPLASSSPPSPHRHFERSRPTFSSPAASCGWVGLRREKSLCGFAVTLPGCPILASFARVGILPLASSDAKTSPRRKHSVTAIPHTCHLTRLKRASTFPSAVLPPERKKVPAMRDYPWVPVISAALQEINVHNLPKRIAIAERAISERLASRNALDSEERMRLRDAANALRDLKKEIR